MPAVAYHVEDNPVFKALKRKERQLSGTPDGTLKCIFLGDAGCGMLRELKPFGAREVCGEQLIKYFLSRSSVDVVGVFSPYRSPTSSFPSSGFPFAAMETQSFYPKRTAQPADCALVQKMVTELPRPS